MATFFAISPAGKKRRAARLSFAVLGGVAALVTGCGAAHAQSVISLPEVDGIVRTYAIQGHTLYIGGDFTSVGGKARTGAAAIDLSTGAVTDFAPVLANSVLSGFAVRDMKFTADGNLWLAGNFDSANGQARNAIAQYNISGAGSLNAITIANDASIDTGIKSIVLDNSGNIYAAGAFTYFGDPSVTVSSGLAEVTATGAAVSSFMPTTSQNFGNQYRGMTISGDGSKLYLAFAGVAQQWDGGSGTTYTRSGFVQLNTSDGTATDFNFNTMQAGFISQGFAVKVIGNDLYIGGQMDTITDDNVPRKGMAKFNNANGALTLDTTFAPTDSSNGPSSAVRGFASAGGDDLYVIGDFTSDSGVANNGLMAVNAKTGALDQSWSVSASSNFGGAGVRILGFEGDGLAPAAIFTSTGSNGNGFDTTVTGTNGTHDAHYYVGLTVPSSSAAPEPGSLLLLGSAALPLVGIVANRRRRAS